MQIFTNSWMSVAALLLIAPPVLAQGGATLGDATFYAISDLTYEPGAYPTLIGGKPAKPSDWPANFYSISVGASCTSTLVSSRVLLTAAHCVGNGKTVTINRSGDSFTGKCTHANEYATNDTADYALCLMTGDVRAHKYERVNIDPSRILLGQTLLLTGFGCTEIGGGGGNDGIYRIGNAAIQVLPAGGNNDIVTKGEVALCFGDSGGPSYLLEDGTSEGTRLQIAVNSRGNIFNTSYLSSLSTPTAVEFLHTWASANDAAICGVHPEALNCR